MINIIFHDGTVKQYKAGVTGQEIVQSLSISLFKKAVAIEVNNELKDLYIPIINNATVKIITVDSAEGIKILRHDTAHTLAQAVKKLFPNTQVVIGPVIKDGFYYDFASEKPFTSMDLEAIEQEMKDIIAKNYLIRREVWLRSKAIEFFKQQKEFYKVKLIDEIPESEEISIYRQGDFIDLCRGPHAPSTGHCSKYFKLTKVAGSYWRGDSKNAVLQRIYGTAWGKKSDLDAYLNRIADAQRRDHRKLGRELELFHFQDEAQGIPFWHDKGWTIFSIIKNYISYQIQRSGYIEVNTPMVLNQKLWEKSGHWEKFRESMFTLNTNTASQDLIQDKNLALKPMNCPGHIQIFNYTTRSYRDLPLRMAEFGACHRYEPSGALYGLMRVRSFIQDDAHIFCTEDQITDETIKFYHLLKLIYQDFGFSEVRIKFSDRPKNYAGTSEIWDKAEQALIYAIEILEDKYTINRGEGAFYGPKLEFILTDAIGREWQCGTLQVDFILPERLDASYITAEGTKKRPVILHRAILGSLERFIGILIEHYSGKLPVWLAPIQVAIATITDESSNYAKQLHNELINNNIRSKLDISSQKINYKIRSFFAMKVPLIAILGKKEVESGKVVIRRLGTQEQQVMSSSELIAHIKKTNKIN
ncbi:threonine--tRNA ligase [Orientia chuto str. Dubai]|uniref:Threonine--tRNA ligase n=1 Tax=Orientia chuto str. Dubai TaxID=1359168 RepID=A0A0F3MKF1_9RICK|nr:threonine--tRNA ligase [Candidatus Orientia mediorientalis]KJV56263.1 threonine--tRNA ligase [Orientia chuto str. Dubai]